MHLVILLAVGGASVVMLARFLATPHMALRERPASLVPSLSGLAVGVAGALTLLSTQADLVPDEVEAVLAPIAVITVSLVLGAIAWQRIFRS